MKTEDLVGTMVTGSQPHRSIYLERFSKQADAGDQIQVLMLLIASTLLAEPSLLCPKNLLFITQFFHLYGL